MLGLSRRGIASALSRSLPLFTEVAATTFRCQGYASSSSKTSSSLSTRSFPEQTRTERIEELRKRSKESMLAYEEQCQKKKYPKVPEPPPDIGHLHLHHLDSPISKTMQPIQEALEHYILNTWLPFYPRGARLRKLQRDVAFRMDKPERPGKLPYEDLLPLIGKLEREGKVRIRVGKQGRVVIYQPTAEQIEGEKMKAKIDNAVRKLEEAAPPRPKEGDFEEPGEYDDFHQMMKSARGSKRRAVPGDDDTGENFFDMFGDDERKRR